MKKSTAAVLLIVLAVIGSFVTFYTSNLFLSDVSNMFYGVHDVNFISSIPGGIFSIELILAAIYVLRRFRMPEFKKRLALFYTTVLAVLSVIGEAASILTGVMIYKSFTAPYPFPGYTILGIIVNALFFVAAIVINVKVRKTVPDDTDRKKMKVFYIIYSIFLGGLTFFAFNRFGALLWSVTYIQTSTLYLTWPFYIWLLVPMAMLVHVVLYFFDFYKDYPKSEIVNIILIMAVNLVFGLLVFRSGSAHPEFISAVSPALAIERLITLPIDTIFQFAFAFIFGGYYLFITIRAIVKTRKKQQQS